MFDAGERACFLVARNLNRLERHVTALEKVADGVGQG
jgi:hypothetical protein